MVGVLQLQVNLTQFGKVQLVFCITEIISNTLDSHSQIDLIYTDCSNAFSLLTVLVMPQLRFWLPLVFVRDLFWDSYWLNCAKFPVNYLLYADDTKIYEAIKNLSYCMDLYRALEKVQTCWTHNKLILNLSKCIIISYYKKNEWQYDTKWLPPRWYNFTTFR